VLKSRYTFVGIVLALALSMIAILPALAGSFTTGAVNLTVQGGSTSGVGYLNITQDTRVGTTIYVGSSDAAYNKVVVKVTDSSANTASGSLQTVTATVKNSTTGTSISGGITLTETGNDTGIFSGGFLVQGTPTSGNIGGANANTIRVAYAGTGDVVNLAVDSVKPTIASVSPASATTTRATTIDFAGTVTDSGSGIRTDAACGPSAGGIGCATATADVDADLITSGEPRTLSTGKSADLVIRRTVGSTPVTAFVTKTADFSETAIWTATTNGFTFLATRLLTAGAHEWNIQARDRAGNEAITDSSSTSSGSQSLKLTIDSTAPVVDSAETGIAYDSVKKKDSSSANRSSIKLTMKNGAGGTADFIDSTTVQVVDFSVSGNTVTAVTFPNHKVDANLAGSIETRNIIYLTLGTALASNGKPTVSVVGNIADLAGNAASVHDKKAVDKIPPKLTVTITGAATGGTRQVAAGNKTANRITVRVVTDEPVNTTPTIYFQVFAFDSTTDARLEVQAVTSVTPTLVTGTTNTYETKQTNSVAGAASGLVGVYVTATDANSIAGSSGSGGTAAGGSTVGSKVILNKANLFEFDSALAAASVTLSPLSAGSTTTESSSPFVRIDFAEGAEYSINTTGAAFPSTATPKDKFDCSTTLCEGNPGSNVGTTPTTTEVDSQNAVTLSSITLNGDDKMASVGTVDSDSYVLATSGLAVGTHVVKFNGTDVVGNKYTTDQKFTFTVAARKAYSVALSPGYNLVSFPGEPSDSSIDVVMNAAHPAVSVLTYDVTDPNGPWLVATRGTSGSWTGTLTTIDSKHGYWIQTGAFTPIKTLIPERDPASVLPTIPVVKGWNLVPVIDLQLAKVPSQATLAANSSGFTATAYFAGVSWTVAYGFDTQGNAWRKITSTTGDNIGQGKAYWVWATKDGTLVP